MLAVVGIIAVLCAIAIPSIIAIKRSLDFKRVNDHAKQIYLAAQTRLSDLRTNGNLTTLAALEDDKGRTPCPPPPD